VAFLCLLELELHLPDSADLKGKRKELQSLKAQLRNRFGAAVAEVDHHDLWQRATLTTALVGRERRNLDETADALQRFVDARFGDWVNWRRMTVTTDEIRDH
jgi:uncharacterized protein YlxP (DUF503 family)